MTRNSLFLPDEYTAALSALLQFDLSPANLATRAGKAFIASNAEIILRISEGLTTKRGEFLASDYLRSKEIRRAYALYYMTTNLLKIVPPLRELSFSSFFERPSSLKILDLGTGTGAAVWGALGYIQEVYPGTHSEVMMTDSLKENIQEAENTGKHFASSFGIKPSLRFDQFDLRTPENIPQAVKDLAPYDLITMMNVLNELGESKDTLLLETLLSLLDEHGAIIMIEPATRSESRRLLRFRDLAVTMNATIYSPCFRQADCPALLRKDDWCHTDYAWERPAFIKAIDDIVGTLRLSLKSTYFIIRKDGLTLEKALAKKNLHRVVSERFDEKGRIRAILCGEDGRYEHIVNKRDISDSNHYFKKVERYDVIEIHGQQAREHDRRIESDSIFELVLPVLGAR